MTTSFFFPFLLSADDDTDDDDAIESVGGMTFAALRRFIMLETENETTCSVAAANMAANRRQRCILSLAIELVLFAFFGEWLFVLRSTCCRERNFVGVVAGLVFFKIRQTNVCGCSSRMVSLKQPEFKSSRSVPHDAREKKHFIIDAKKVKRHVDTKDTLNKFSFMTG